MPAKQLENYAERSGKSLEEVEEIWDNAKERADQKFEDGEEDPGYWAYVTRITTSKLGIANGGESDKDKEPSKKKTFKEFLKDKKKPKDEKSDEDNEETRSEGDEETLEDDVQADDVNQDDQDKDKQPKPSKVSRKKYEE